MNNKHRWQRVENISKGELELKTHFMNEMTFFIWEAINYLVILVCFFDLECYGVPQFPKW